MKTFSKLIAVATFALSASAFAVPSNQEDRFFTQVTEQQHTIAADGSDRTPQGQTLAENGRNRLEEKGLVQDGYDKTPQGQVVAEGGRDRLKEKGLVQDGSDRTPQGQTLAADGSDHTPGMQVAADGSDRTPGQRLA